MFTRVGQPMSLCCGTACVGEVREGTMSLAQLLPCFQSLPTTKLGPSGADSWVGGFVYVLGPPGSLQWNLLWVWEFLPLMQPPRVFTAKGIETLVSHTKTLGCTVSCTLQVFLLAYLHMNVGPPGPPASALPAQFATLPHIRSALAAHLCPTSLDEFFFFNSLVVGFHTFQFSGSSGFLFWNLLSFRLCKEAKCIYLCLHFGQWSAVCIYNSQVLEVPKCPPDDWIK